MARSHRELVTFFLLSFLLLQSLVLAVPAQRLERENMRSLVSEGVVISQVYGGGGNAGATFTHDFVELFNRGSAPVSILGWSIQYASATGTGNFGNGTGQITELPNVTIQPGQYYLVQEASTAAVGSPLPTADHVDPTPINMSGTAGKVALANIATSLGCNGGSTACTPAQLAQIVDLVGYGTANFFEGTGAVPTLTNTTAGIRNSGGCAETDNNNVDFATGTPVPRNTSTPQAPCTPISTAPSGVGAATPSSRLPGESTLLTVTVTLGTNPASTGILVSADLTAIGGSSDQTFFDDGSNGDVAMGDNVFSYLATVGVATAPGTKLLPAEITDAQARTGSTNIELTITSVSSSPSGIGSAAPSTVPAGGATTLTVSVQPGTNPTSTGLSVVGNLSAIGGSASQSFFDDGSNGDATPGDNVFTYSAIVDGSTSGGLKSLPVTITDAQARVGNTSISLMVTVAQGPGEPLPFSQNWSNTGLISTDNNWSGVPGIVGYRGDGLAGATGVDPQTILQDGSATPVNVLANQTNPNILTSGGIAEFELANPVVGFQGSGTARAPHLVISANTVGATNIAVTYNLRDVDGSADNSVQPVALHYRIGSAGNFTNIPGAFVADASSGPNQADLVTAVGVLLPAEAEGHPLVQLRIMTADAVGSDEWIGVDSILIVSNGTLPMAVSGSASPTLVNAGSQTLLTATVTPGTNPVSTGITVDGDLSSIGGLANQQLYDDGTNGDVTPSDNIFSYLATLPVATSSGSRSLPIVVEDDQARTATTSIGLTVRAAANPLVHLTMGNPSGATVDVNQPDNYLMLKDQYALSYHRDRGTPNWAAWHLDTSWIGSAPRQDDFRPDLTLPLGWYQVTEFDYSGSGFDRGHHTPSGDRTASVPDNSETFLMTNMMPQAPDNNQGPWEQLESFGRTVANQGDELYIYMGGVGIGGTGSNGGVTVTVANGNVTVPAYTWKVMMVLPSGDNDVSRADINTRAIAVIMPNHQGIRNDQWQKYLATVDQVEAMTGYDFFSNVSLEIQNVIEARLDPASNTAPQSIGGGLFTDLAIDAPNTTLTGDVTVTGTLTLGGSTLRTGTNNKITLGPNANVVRISGMIDGNFEKVFETLDQFEFPVGTTQGYTPVTAQPTVLSISPSSLTVASIDGIHPNAPSPNVALRRYWRLVETGDLTLNLRFHYLDNDVPQAIFNESTFTLRRYSGVFTPVSTQVNSTANTLSATGVSTFSDWTAFGSLSPTSASSIVSGRLVDSSGRAVFGATVSLIDMSGRVRNTISNPFGYFALEGVPAGQSYTAVITHRIFSFESQVISVSDDVTDLIFVANP